MAQNDQNRKSDTPDSDILGDIDPIDAVQGDDSAHRSGGSTSGVGGTDADDEDSGVSGLGRRDSDRGRDNPQREPRTGPIG